MIGFDPFDGEEQVEARKLGISWHVRLRTAFCPFNLYKAMSSEAGNVLTSLS